MISLPPRQLIHLKTLVSAHALQLTISFSMIPIAHALVFGRLIEQARHFLLCMQP